MHKIKKFHSNQVNSPQAMVEAMNMKRSIYFATLQGYVIFETELYARVNMPNYLNVSALVTKI